jgi:hypothetical protein
MRSTFPSGNVFKNGLDFHKRHAIEILDASAWLRRNGLPRVVDIW